MQRKIDVTKLDAISSRLPKVFSGCTILHVSDLHCRRFGNEQEQLIRISKALKPDYIFITGDMIDQHHKSIESALEYVNGIFDLAPIYYVTGNHEWQCREKRKHLFSCMKKQGVHILSDEIIELERGGEKIELLGVEDPYELEGKKTRQYQRVSSRAFLQRFVEVNNRRTDKFSILLSHRPEFIRFYEKAHIDLVFSGHAHGGQIRIPGRGGILSPHQGFFPQYTEGIIRDGNTQMVVSRGLGNSGFPFRVNNTPELLLVTLQRNGR